MNTRACLTAAAMVVLMGAQPVPVPAPTPAPAPAPTAVADDGYPALQSWQHEQEFATRLRQEIQRVYLPLLARPTAYKSVFNDPVPEQSSNWRYLRTDVKSQVLAKREGVDKQMRARGGLASREIDRLYAARPDKRPEELRQMLLNSPRIDDVTVELLRVQPLDDKTTRVDFNVVLTCDGVNATNAFRDIDVVKQEGQFLFPSKLVLDITCSPGLSAGTVTNLLDSVQSALTK